MYSLMSDLPIDRSRKDLSSPPQTWGWWSFKQWWNYDELQ